MSRGLTIVAFLVLALALPLRARADVGVYPITKVVPVGGVIHGWGDGSGMPVYLVPAAAGPRRYDCHGSGTCEPTSERSPGKPFVFLGRLRRTKNVYADQRFDFVVPAELHPGAYRMYLYCRPCGRSLIQSGGRLEGETIRITARPESRTVHIGVGAADVRFLMSEPPGVILLLRLTVPLGMRVSATGYIPSVASVVVSSALCRRRGSLDVCTQAVEWCPMPAAAWRFRLRKLGGPAGRVRLDFVVGRPR
jgi:hypothetical protein